MENQAKPTSENANANQALFDYLNGCLFDNTLPPCMIVQSRNKNVIAGYYAPEQWQNDEGEKIAEIGINSNVLAAGDLVDVLDTIIHELVHHWQSAHGKPSRRGYHNTEWTDKAEAIGLTPSGKGQQVDTAVTPNGLAELAILDCPEDSIYPWIATVDNGGEQDTPGDTPKPKMYGGGGRVKYSCPICFMNVWGKSGLRVSCSDCDMLLVAAAQEG